MLSTLRAKLLAAGLDYTQASDACFAVFYDHGSVHPKAMPFAAPYLDRLSSVGRYEDQRKQAMLGRTIAVKLHKEDPSAAQDEAKTLRIEVLSLLAADAITKFRKAGIGPQRRDGVEIFMMCRDELAHHRIRRGYPWIWAIADAIVARELATMSKRMRVVDFEAHESTVDDAEQEAIAIEEASKATLEKTRVIP